MKILSRSEELVLLTVWKLQKEAYGVTIRKHIITHTGSNWSIGAIYVPLDRLTKWGYLKTEQGDPKPERGGRSKRFYELTADGLKALHHLKSVQQSMWDNLPDLAFDFTGK